jgi:hypothetical protein
MVGDKLIDGRKEWTFLRHRLSLEILDEFQHRGLFFRIQSVDGIDQTGLGHWVWSLLEYSLTTSSALTQAPVPVLPRHDHQHYAGRMFQPVVHRLVRL